MMAMGMIHIRWLSQGFTQDFFCSAILKGKDIHEPPASTSSREAFQLQMLRDTQGKANTFFRRAGFRYTISAGITTFHKSFLYLVLIVVVT